MMPILFTQPECQKCDWLKERLSSDSGVQILDITTTEGLASAAYYELIEKHTPILVTEDETIIEGSVKIKRELIKGGHIGKRQ